MTVRIALTRRQEAFIASLIAEGLYKDASEAVSEGLLRIERERAEHVAKLASLRSEVQQGIDDLDHGRFTELNGDNELDAHFAELSAQAARRVAARHLAS